MTLPNRSGYSVSDVSHSVNNANQSNVARKGQPMVVAPPSPLAPPQIPIAVGVYAAPPGMYNPVNGSPASYEVMKQHFTGFVPPMNVIPVQAAQPSSSNMQSSVNPAMMNEYMTLNSVSPGPSNPMDKNNQYPPQEDYMPTQKIDGQTQPSQSNKAQTAVPDNFSLEEVQARKNYVRGHRLLPNILEVLNSCRKEGMLWQPNIDQALLQSMMTPLSENGADVSLEDFLHSQGIETNSLNSEDMQKNAERQEFIMRLEQIKEKYHDELERLNRVCNEFCFGMLNLLREQLTIRPVTDQETQMKLLGIQYRFHNVKNKLRQNVFSAILALHKQFNQTRKKKRMLPKKATESLSQWFFEHINDPYPSEEEKNTLAAAAGLTLTQVNNWFGNKRIRYKRKCLEEDSKVRTRKGGQHQSVSSPDSDTGLDFSVDHVHV